MRRSALAQSTHQSAGQTAAVFPRREPAFHRRETHHTVTVEHIDHDVEAVNQLRLLKSEGAAREQLEIYFGKNGLTRFERLLALEDTRAMDAAKGGVLRPRLLLASAPRLWLALPARRAGDILRVQGYILAFGLRPADASGSA